ncbi:MAG: thioredoxin-disulfide reductase [Synergistales bacterium]|nr:thioredoxin-disulfide reductase [Synergistales bacterium]
MEKRELVIIGAGPAGMSAAIYGKRSGLDVLLLEQGMPGGQVNITDEIENWPGVQHASGPELVDSFRKHAEKFGTEFREADVKSVELRDGEKVVVTDQGELQAEAVIVATGASFRKLGCPGESDYTGRGVSYCAVCDGAFFEEQTIAVIGGGNTAVEEAVYLTQFAEKVYIIHRRDSFRADRVAIEQAMSNDRIVPVWNSVVESIQGTDMVEKVVLRNTKTGETSELPVAGVFVFVGSTPNDEAVRGLLESSKGGWITTKESMETSVEGIFAAGDVRDKFLRQVVTAASDGAVAAMAAYGYISQQLHLRSTLLEPEETTAFFYSSIDEKQAHLSAELETWLDENGKELTLIDGYTNARMAEKLDLEKMPVLVKFKRGAVESATVVHSLEDIKSQL